MTDSADYTNFKAKTELISRRLNDLIPAVSNSSNFGIGFADQVQRLGGDVGYLKDLHRLLREAEQVLEELEMSVGIAQTPPEDL